MVSEVRLTILGQLRINDQLWILKAWTAISAEREIALTTIKPYLLVAPYSYTMIPRWLKLKRVRYFFSDF